MARRFYLASTGSPPVTPTINSGSYWLHANTLRLPMRLTPGSTALTNIAYTPDAADHGVDGQAMVVQYISEERLQAQLINSGAGAMWWVVAQCFQPNLTCNQFIQIRLLIVSEDGLTIKELLRTGRGFTEMNTVLQSRSLQDSTSTATVEAGDRIVLEIGCGGVPAGGGGVQGHNCTLRVGESAAGGDLPLDEVATATDQRPWLEFQQNLLFLGGVVSGSEAVSGGGAVTATGRKLAEGEIASDTFDGDGALGAGWSVTQGTPTRVSGEYSGGAGNNMAVRTETYDLHQWVEFTQRTVTGYWIIPLRYRSSDGDFYYASWSAGSQNFYVGKYDGGFGDITSYPSVAIPAGARVRIEIDSTAVRGYVDGVLKTCAYHDNLLPAGPPGLLVSNGTLDDFVAGNLPAPTGVNTVSDAFTRTGAMGVDWALQNPSSLYPQCDGDEAVGSAAVIQAAWYGSKQWHAHQKASIVVGYAGVSPTNAWLGPWVRGHNVGADFWAYVWHTPTAVVTPPDAPGRNAINRVEGGSFINLLDVSTAVAIGDSMELEVETIDASTVRLTARLNGIVVGTVDDTASTRITRAGAPGFDCYNDARVASFNATDVFGPIVAFGVALISAGGDVAVTGRKSISAVVSVSAGGAVTATGKKSSSAVAGITAGGAVTATGRKTVSATADITAGSVVTDVGTAFVDLRSGTASVSAGAAVTATGSKSSSGQAGVSAGGVVTVTARKSVTRTADITAGGVVTDTGRKSASGQESITAGATVLVIGAKVGVVSGRIKVWTGSTWKECPVLVWNGSAWVEKPMKFWNGSTWVNA